MKFYKSIDNKTKNCNHRKINDEPEIPAKKNKLFVKIIDYLFELMIKKNFCSVRVKNKQNYELRNPEFASLFYGFHGCWWDGPIATILCRKLYNCNFYMMIKELRRFPALAMAGGFSIEKESAHESINYSVKLLENSENTLWIFPQGKVYPSNFRPLNFEGGIAHICKKIKKLNLIPVACNYTFLRGEKPEILIEIGKPIILEEGIKRKKDFLCCLQREFELFIDNQKLEISKEQFEEYEYILYNNFSWLKLIEKNLQFIVRKKYIL
ncbi:MAG TPA: lysophospholipid acyltransferase family protein [Candidatus Gastranaerophilales bacterium]|nr:lysophospholipid acyltransferase family protein [Candidatus Gastranaerophilales bacterium]